MTPESQSPPATVTHSQAVEAAKRLIASQSEDLDESAMWDRIRDGVKVARFILQPAPPAEAFDATFFLRNVLSQGGAIQQDYADKPYEEYARRLDRAAVERAAELSALIAAQGRAGDAWLPIETAPKDGKWILAVMRTKRQAVVRWIGNGVWEDDNRLYRDPILWQPLPPIPSPTPATE